MTNPIASLTTIDLEDYASIKKHLPLATSKQVKWIKEMFDIARSLGYQEPIAEDYLAMCDSINSDRIPPEVNHRIQIQLLSRIKDSMASERKRRLKKYEPKAQISLFHPEAFENL